VKQAALCAIWAIATPESYRSIVDRFDVSKSTAHIFVVRFRDAANRLSDTYFKWPSERSQADADRRIQGLHGMPGRVGFTDGCHVHMRCPPDTTYINRKGVASIILQGTVNHDLVVIDVYAGSPGWGNDARVFRKCPLRGRLKHEDSALLDGSRHLLGDTAYPLLRKLLTPYKDYGHLTEKQLRYNLIHSRIRVKVENALGRLKGKFRRLKHFDVTPCRSPFRLSRRRVYCTTTFCFLVTQSRTPEMRTNASRTGKTRHIRTQ
jgi:hypothetical protein